MQCQWKTNEKFVVSCASLLTMIHIAGLNKLDSRFRCHFNFS